MEKMYRVKRTSPRQTTYFHEESATGFSEKEFSVFNSKSMANGVARALDSIESETTNLSSYEVEQVEEEYFYPRYISLAKEITSSSFCPYCGRDDTRFDNDGNFHCNVCYLRVEKKFFDMIEKE